MFSNWPKWDDLGNGYPGEDLRVRCVFDVLAPAHYDGKRCPIYEAGHEETPEPEDVWRVAEQIVANIERDFLIVKKTGGEER